MNVMNFNILHRICTSIFISFENKVIEPRLCPHIIILVIAVCLSVILTF
jgi:hypothetical protein